MQSVYLEREREKVRNFNFIIVSVHPRDLLPECSEVINMGLKDASPHPPPLLSLKGNSDLGPISWIYEQSIETHPPDGTIQ